MAMIHQWPLQEVLPATTAQDVVGSVDGVYNGSPDYSQNETFSTNPNLKSVLLNTTAGARDTNKAAYIDLLSGSNASGLQIPFAGNRSIFVFFRPINDDDAPPHQTGQNQTGMIFYANFAGAHPFIQVTYKYRDRNPNDSGGGVEVKEFELIITADNVTGSQFAVDLDPTDSTTDTENPWYIVGVTWNTAQATLHVYNFTTKTWTHSSDNNSGNGYAMPAGNFDQCFFGVSPLLSGWLSHISIFDTALSDAEVEAETFNPPIVSTLPCSRSPFLVGIIEGLWDAAESVMTCTAELQTQTLSGQWVASASGVKCNLELSGTRRELDSTDNWRVIQTWLVTMSGRYSLPVPTDNSNIRFVIGNLTLQSYQYYQSPDDVITAVECERVQA